MRLLLDTHILIWWLVDDPALPKAARDAMADPRAEIFVSAATAWEIAIKQAFGRLRFPVAQLPSLHADERMTPLPVSIAHALLAGSLPPHHHDPFDRMLIPQAQHEGLTIVSLDAMIGAIRSPFWARRLHRLPFQGYLFIIRLVAPIL